MEEEHDEEFNDNKEEQEQEEEYNKVKESFKVKINTIYW